MEIKDMGKIKDKWKARAGVASGDYKDGVNSTKKDWATNTRAASASWEQGVQSAINDRRFEKGVDEAGTDKWKRKAADLGASRFGPGVAAAVGDFDKGFAKYHSVIAGLSLPPRYPRGDPRNLERVKVVAEALHTARVG